LSVYLDASVIVPTLVSEPSSPTVHAFLLANIRPILISDFAASEVASALSRLVRTGDLDRTDAEQRLVTFDAWLAADPQVPAVEIGDVPLAAALVRRFELKLRTPDALHIVLADRLGAELVTRDDRLARAANTIGVPVTFL
jgi:uncharacterized protein